MSETERSGVGQRRYCTSEDYRGLLDGGEELGEGVEARAGRVQLPQRENRAVHGVHAVADRRRRLLRLLLRLLRLVASGPNGGSIGGIGVGGVGNNLWNLSCEVHARAVADEHAREDPFVRVQLPRQRPGRQ